MSVASNTISLATFDTKKACQILKPLITKGTTLPAYKTWNCRCDGLSQLALRLHVYEGEGTELNPERVELILEVVVHHLPQHAPDVEFTFQLDEIQKVTVHAKDQSGKVIQCDHIYQTARAHMTSLIERKAQLESQLKVVNARIGSAFDVFISAKSSDHSIASEIQTFLASHGLDAFLSSVSLPSLSNSDYRKEIDRALDQCQNMIVVATSVDNVLSPWVEAEWGLFINEKRSGRKSGNIVTVVAGDLQSQDLPASLRYFEVLPFDAGHLYRLLRYVAQ